MADGRENLTHKLTVEEARKGGQKSGETRRNKANLRKCLELLLENEVKDKSGRPAKDADGNVLTGAEALSVKLFQAALKGDIRAFEVLRDTAGQKPVDTVQQTTTTIDMSKFTTKQIKEMLDSEVDANDLA